MATQSVTQDRPTSSDPMEELHAGSMFEAAIRFADWADEQRHLNAGKIIDRFNLNRATAYRWLNAYRAARGFA